MRSMLPGCTARVVSTFPWMIVSCPVSRNSRAAIALHVPGNRIDRSVHAHQPALVLTGAADTHAAAHVGLVGKLAGHMQCRAQRLQRRKHALRPAGAQTVEPSGAQERRGDRRHLSRGSRRAVFRCRARRHTETGQNGPRTTGHARSARPAPLRLPLPHREGRVPGSTAALPRTPRPPAGRGRCPSVHPVPKGPRTHRESPVESACSASLKGPTRATVNMRGSGPAMLKGFSSTPGSQSMQNWPGRAASERSRTRVTVLWFSWIRSTTRALSGVPGGLRHGISPTPVRAADWSLPWGVGVASCRGHRRDTDTRDRPATR